MVFFLVRLERMAREVKEKGADSVPSDYIRTSIRLHGAGLTRTQREEAHTHLIK